MKPGKAPAGASEWETSAECCGGGSGGFYTDDANTGLETLGARVYDPATGRFLPADPVLDTGTPQQINGYDYASNNPAILADAGGTDPCSVGGQGCGTAGSSGKYYPTVEDAAARHDQQRSNDATCSVPGEARPKPLGVNKTVNDPALGSREVPLGFLRNNGYTGSTEFTYADALKWVKSSSPAARYVCEHVSGVSRRDSGK